VAERNTNPWFWYRDFGFTTPALKPTVMPVSVNGLWHWLFDTVGHWITTGIPAILSVLNDLMAGHWT